MNAAFADEKNSCFERPIAADTPVRACARLAPE